MRIFGMALALALATSAAGLPALAMGKDTKDAEAAVAALGKRWDQEVLQKTVAAFEPVLAKVSRAGIAASHDIAYGDDAKQKLDVFAPEKAGKGRPVVVYIHGGGLTGGDKDSPKGIINSNVPVYFARHGMVGVSINYRLVPGATYPAGGEDVAKAVAWLHANVTKFGGDPNAMFMIGHSAGGYVLATYLYDAKLAGPAGPRIAGAIFLSGVIELDKEGPRAAVARQYYGDDQSRWAALDPYAQIDGYKGKRIPTFIINAEYDPTEIEMPGGVRHFAKLCALDRGCPRYFQAQDMNHVSTAYSLGTDDDRLGSQMRDFVRKTLAAPEPRKTAQKN